MAMTACMLHGPKTLRAIVPRSPKHRAELVRETAAREGWAYVTIGTAPGVRVVVDQINTGYSVGSTHMDLDIYRSEERAAQAARGTK